MIVYLIEEFEGNIAVCAVPVQACESDVPWLRAAVQGEREVVPFHTLTIILLLKTEEEMKAGTWAYFLLMINSNNGT